MCQGFFLDNRPYVEAVVESQRFATAVPLLFLVDTGADKTSIGGRDAKRLGIDVSTLSNPIKMGGAGGSVEAYPINNNIELMFVDYSPSFNRASLHIETIEEIYIMPTLPINVLGRDIIDRFEMSYKGFSNEIILRRNDFAGGLHHCFSLQIL